MTQMIPQLSHRFGVTIATFLAMTLGALALSLGASPALAARIRPHILESASFSQPGTFDAPTGIAIDRATGNVYVADSEADVVDIFGAEGGAPTGGVPSQITGVEFRSYEPAGIAIDNSCYYHQPRLSGSACEAYDPSDGDVYVTELPYDVIAKYAPSPTSGDYELVADLEDGESTGVAVDTQGNVYVTNQREQAITEFSPSGAEIGKIEQHTLGTPAYVAAGAPGTVYVGNLGGGVVKLAINSSDGVEGEELLDREGGAITVDENGAVFVDEGFQIAEYNSSDHLESKFGYELFAGSAGVAVNDETGNVYVTDPGENRDIDVFGTPVVVPEAVTGSATVEKAGTTIHATLDGSVNPESTSVTSCKFEYGLSTSSSYEHTAPCSQALPITGSTPVPVVAELNALHGNTTYRYTLIAGNENGPSTGKERRFTTAVAPSVNDQAPSVQAVTQTTALIAATIDTENSNTGYDVEYVEAAEYNSGADDPYAAGSTTAPTSMSAGVGDEPETIAVTGLRSGTVYDYRVSATNQGGIEYGPNYSFTTDSSTPPTAKTEEASEVTQTSVTLNGLVDGEGLQTTYRFELGSNTEYGTVIAGSAAPEGQAITANIQGLAPATTYHVRIVAANADGTTYGSDRTFTTAGYSSLAATPVSASPVLTGLVPVPAPKTSTPTGAKPLTRAHKLSKALKLCKRDKSKAKREKCEAAAKVKYDSKSKANKRRRSKR